MTKTQRWLIRISCTTLLAGLIADPAGAQSFRKGPYLMFRGDNTRMDVLWQTTSASTDTIRWGDEFSNVIGADTSTPYGSDFQHRYELTQLMPGTMVIYEVTVGAVTVVDSFRTAPPDSQRSIKFIVYGDTRTNVSMHDRVADSILSQVNRDSGFRSILLSVGDLVSDGQQESYWTSELFNHSWPGLQSMLAGLPYQSCRGNHEGNGILFGKYFPYPYIGGMYWSFDYGPAHFAVVDQYTAYGTGSAQLQWLDRDLAGSAKRWKFILLHEPGWSAGGGHANSTGVQQYIEPLCEKYHVPVVFGGHNHYYARARIDGAGGFSVYHITTGGGGAPLYTPQTGQPGIVTATSANHFCTVEIEDDTLLLFRAIATDGRLIDSFSVPVPAAPSTGVADASPFSTGYSLHPAYPNPFNPGTSIRFVLPVESRVVARIFDILGREVATISEGILTAGEHTARWIPRDMPSGVYFCRLEASPHYRPVRSFTLTRTLILSK